MNQNNWIYSFKNKKQQYEIKIFFFDIKYLSRFLKVNSLPHWLVYDLEAYFFRAAIAFWTDI